MTEKKKPAYDLDAIKAVFSSIGTLNATNTAVKNAAALGFGRTDIVEIIQTIQHNPHFRKSMTANANYRLWQDVYYVPSSMGMLYIKFTVDPPSNNFLLLQFKENDSND